MKTIGSFVLVRMFKRTEERGIALPEISSDTSEGEVIEIGTKTLDDHGNPFEFHVKPGDTIGFEPKVLFPVTWDGEQRDRYMIKHSDILYKHETD